MGQRLDVEDLPLVSATGSIPETPFAMDLGFHVPGYGVERQWTNDAAYEIVAHVRGRRYNVGFDVDGRSIRICAHRDKWTSNGFEDE